jgi:hypothetical protein
MVVWSLSDGVREKRPQQDLYARTLQQVTDQARAGQEARGIATMPYGAGLENHNVAAEVQPLRPGFCRVRGA